MKLRLIIFILLINQSLIAQNYISVGANKYFLGCKLDKKEYSRVPESNYPKTRGLEKLQNSFSLSKYLPEVGNQGNTGTCTSWATSYYTLSLLYNIENDKQKFSFSPFFLYNNIKEIKDSACQNGASIAEALEFLKYKGGILSSKYLDQCRFNKDTSTKNWDLAINYRIKNYKSIGQDNRIQRIKKSLSLLKPIVIAINTPYSFATSLNGDTWDGIVDDMRGGHALSLIGYDDNKEGGCFEIINSWGKEWGDNGKIWIKYSDFEKLVYEVYEVTGYTNKELERFRKKNNFEGAIKIFDKEGKTLEEEKSIDLELYDMNYDSTDFIIDTNVNAIDTIFSLDDTIIDSDIKNLEAMSNQDEIMNDLNNFKPKILEYTFENQYLLDYDKEFKFKITNSDSAYIYLFSYDDVYSTITPITKNNNSVIYLNKKKPDIILPETNYLKLENYSSFLKKYALLVSKEIINDNRIEEICGKNYKSISDFINFNFEYDLVLKTPEKFGSGFQLKNDPGKILPIIINIVNRQLE